jgi:hypothetical protein
MLRRLLAIASALTLLPLLAPGAAAQSQNDGSIYSGYGLGTRYSFQSSQAQAMGGSGMALRSFNYISLDNPASWSDQFLVRFGGGVRLDNVTATDQSDNTSRLSSSALNAVHLGVPLYAGKLGIVASLRPYTDVNFRVDQPGSFTGLGGEPTEYVLRYEGNGGIQELQVGAGYLATENLTVGASAGFLFGIVEESQRTVFPEFSGLINPSLVTTVLTESTRVFGFTANVGATVSLPGLFSDEDAFTAAASLTLPPSLSADRATTLGESLNKDTLGTQQEGTIDLPLTVRGGLSYNDGSRWLVAADVLYEPWSEFSSDLPISGLVQSDGASLGDRLRVGGGVQFLPIGRRPGGSYLRRTAYRLGAYYDRDYVQPQAGYTLRTIAVTAGLSLPTVLPGTRLDTNVEVGRRGTTDFGLVRDTFVRFTVTANVGERWFVRRRLR